MGWSIKEWVHSVSRDKDGDTRFWVPRLSFSSSIARKWWNCILSQLRVDSESTVASLISLVLVLFVVALGVSRAPGFVLGVLVCRVLFVRADKQTNRTRRVLFSVCYVHRAVFSVTCAVLCYMWRVLLCSPQACLVMDPAQRPDCGSLLQMELFTQDQFSVTHTQEIRRRLQQVGNRL